MVNKWQVMAQLHHLKLTGQKERRHGGEKKHHDKQFFAENHRNHSAKTKAQYYANLYRTHAY